MTKPARSFCVALVVRSDRRRRRPVGGSRRLAAVARPGPQQRLEGDRPAQAMAGRPARRSSWSVAGIGAGYGSVAIKDDRIFVQGSAGRRSVVYTLNRADGKGALVQGARFGGQQRPGIGTEKHADRRRRPRLRVDGERRSRVPEGAGRDGGLAAEHPEGFRRPQHQLAAQRIAARRRQPRHRHARRARRRHGRAGQDVRADRLGRQGAERRGGLRVGDRRPTCRASGRS